MNFKELTQYMVVMANYKYKCDCGHVVQIIPPHTNKICSWCGKLVFESKLEEFKYRLLKAKRKAEKDMYPTKELALRFQLSKIHNTSIYYILDNTVWECPLELEEHLQSKCEENAGLGKDWYQDKLTEIEELTGAELKNRMQREIFNLEF